MKYLMSAATDNELTICCNPSLSDAVLIYCIQVLEKKNA